ncbi:MAG TPA: ABC transporter permease subunit [Solirubrobacteraceae bacterium]
MASVSGQSGVFLGADQLIDELSEGSAPAGDSRRRRRPGRPRLWRITIFVLAAIFFLGPLISAFKFSLITANGSYGFSNYGDIVDSSAIRSSLLTSLEIAAIAAVVVVTLMLPTVVWVRLRRPKLTLLLEGITLLPIVIPPVVVAAGLEELQRNAPSWVVSLFFNHALTGLTPFYVVLAMPFTYRALDTGVRSIDLRTLVDASRSLGASWFTTLTRVILPNVQTAVLGAMFLTIALCLGEVIISSLLLYTTFPVEIIQQSLSGTAGISVALSIITLLFTFLLLFSLSFIGRRRAGAGRVF